MMRQKTRRVVAASAAALAMAASINVSAGTIQLGFILDRSGSIGSSNWNIIVDGLSSAINSLIPIGGSDTYEISVVTFADTATIDIANFVVGTAADRTALATAIANLGNNRPNDVYVGGLTNYEDAFIKMLDALDNTATADKRYVNFATDGDPTECNNWPDCVPGDGDPFDADENAAGIRARNSLVAFLGSTGNISIEGIGAFVDSTNLQDNYCYPGPCDITAPYNFPAQGFYIGVADANGYAAAIGNKLRVVTGQVPEPGTLALLSLGLLGLGVSRRRKD